MAQEPSAADQVAILQCHVTDLIAAVQHLTDAMHQRDGQITLLMEQFQELKAEHEAWKQEETEEEEAMQASRPVLPDLPKPLPEGWTRCFIDGDVKYVDMLNKVMTAVRPMVPAQKNSEIVIEDDDNEPNRLQ